jgi:hypothetical protein
MGLPSKKTVQSEAAKACEALDKEKNPLSEEECISFVHGAGL